MSSDSDCEFCSVMLAMLLMWEGIAGGPDVWEIARDLKGVAGMDERAAERLRHVLGCPPTQSAA